MERLKISSKNLNLVINKVIKVIKKGGVIVCPTDTVYGLIADAMNKKAVKKVFQIKKRTFQKPIPVFVKNLRMAKSLAVINKKQEKFLEKFWPGKITAILRAKEKLPKGILKNGKIGLRIPNYKLLNILLEKLNFPLTGTSANISGRPASTKIKKILNQLENQKHKPDLILDAADLKPSLPSTVIDAEGFRVLRKGAVSKKEIFGKMKIWN